MKNTLRRLSPWILLACLCGCVLTAQAQASDSVSDHGNRQIVSIGHNSYLPAGEQAQDVVAVMGDTKVDGDATDAAVAVMGNTTVNGTVGHGGAVAVLGDVYINGKVRGDVVAVLGSVTLGPNAVVKGQVTEVFGGLERSPTAVVQGGTSSVLSFGRLEGLHSWFRDCLLFGRPLAPTALVGWAWWLSLALLALYLLIAAVFRDGVQRCIDTLETHPGHSILATVIVALLVPVVLLALVITVVGIAVVPLFWIALICAGIFGRVVALGWLGGRCLRLAHAGEGLHPVLAVLAGSLLALALYMVPVLGFLVYVLLGVFGFGAVMYALLLAVRPEGSRPAAPGPGIGAGGTAGAAPGTVLAASASATDASSAYTSGYRASPEEQVGARMGTEASGLPPYGAAAPSAAAPVLDVTTLPHAGFWIRMLALLIDTVLIAIAMGWLLGHGSSVLLVLAVYGAIMWKFKGTTIGGIVCDLKVVRVGGAPLDWGTAIIRALGCFLSLVVAGLGFIWIAIDREHQAWHDKIAGTVVVRVPKSAGLI
jgi:uncharacterized RDD family membrane protein YckC/cytoskeletal protein CcmA (bactofilin family)